MTRTTKPQGSYGWSCASFIVGCFFLAVTLFVNTQFGYSLGLSDLSKGAQAALSVGVDVGFAVAAGAAGYLLRRRQWLLGALTALVGVIFGFYTFVSMVGWGASDRLAKARLVEMNAMAEERAGREANEALMREYTATLSWLRGTVVKSDDRRDRGQLLAALKEAMKEPPQVKAVRPADMVIADAQSDALASVGKMLGLNVDSRDVLLALIVVLAALGIVGKGFFLFLGGFLWPRRSLEAAETSKPAALGDPGGDGRAPSGGEPARVPGSQFDVVVPFNQVRVAMSHGDERPFVAPPAANDRVAGEAAGNAALAPRETVYPAPKTVYPGPGETVYASPKTVYSDGENSEPSQGSPTVTPGMDCLPSTVTPGETVSPSTVTPKETVEAQAVPLRETVHAAGLDRQTVYRPETVYPGGPGETVSCAAAGQPGGEAPPLSPGETVEATKSKEGDGRAGGDGAQARHSSEAADKVVAIRETVSGANRRPRTVSRLGFGLPLFDPAVQLERPISPLFPGELSTVDRLVAEAARRIAGKVPPDSPRERARWAVRRFIDEATVRAPGQCILAAHLYDRFNDYRRRLGVEEVITQTKFGRLMAEQGVKKIHSKGAIYYVGLVPAGEVPVAAAA